MSSAQSPNAPRAVPAKDHVPATSPVLAASESAKTAAPGVSRTAAPESTKTATPEAMKASASETSKPAAQGAGQPLKVDPAIDALLGVVLPVAVPAIQGAIKNELNKVMDAISRKHPNKSLWEIFGDAIANYEKPIFDRLHLTGFIAKATNFSKKLFALIQDDPNLKSLRDVAKKWDTKTIQSALGSGLQVTAETLRKDLFEAEPTGAIEGMVAMNKVKLATDDPAHKALVVQTLAQMGSKDMADKSPNAIFAANPEILAPVPAAQRPAVVADINTLATAQTIAPTTKAMRVLVNKGLTTAAAVGSIPKERFITSHADVMSRSEAAAIHETAAKVNLSNTATLMHIVQKVRGSMPVIDGAGDPASRILQVRQEIAKYGHSLSLADLFGPMDQAVVDHDTSVYSASAYFVDLLLYLRSHNIDTNKPAANLTKSGESDSLSGTVLEKLFRRRPDLANLELTPENTNTTIPYIDLANEVMECFVAYLPLYMDDMKRPRQATIDAFNVGHEDSDELLSQPQHLRLEAYRELATSVYPPGLPYHQPLDAQRIFLQFLGVSRADLVDTFRARTVHGVPANPGIKSPTSIGNGLLSPQPDPTLSRLQRRALYAQFYSEVLNMNQEEFLILTKGVFWEKEFFQLIEGLPSLSSTDYQRRIGLRPVNNYWGYTSEADMLSSEVATKLGATFVAQQLLPRSGLAFTELVQIVETTFVNPGLSRGQDGNLAKRLRFSYRFLQQLVDERGSRRYDRLALFLSRNTDIFDVPTLARANTNSEDQSEPLVADITTIKTWVAESFVRLGKITVLDSGQGPTLLAYGQVIAHNLDAAQNQPSLPFDKTAILTSDGRLFDSSNAEYSIARIGDLSADGRITDGQGRPIGQVGIAGDVFYKNPVDSNDFNTAFPRVDFNVNATGDGKTPDVAWHITGGKLRPGSASDATSDKVTSVWTLDPAMGGETSLEDMRLMHLDGTTLSTYEWDRLHRFIRIWRKLGWTVQETDRALSNLPRPKEIKSTPQQNGVHPASPGADVSSKGTMSPTGAGGDFDSTMFDRPITFDDFADDWPNDDSTISGPAQPNADIAFATIQQLAAMKQILNLTTLSVEQLLTFWSDMTSDGPNSQYYKLFFKRNLRGKDLIFSPDADGNFFTSASATLTISLHRPVIMAAFHLTSADLDYLLNLYLSMQDFKEFVVTDMLSMRNLSLIYSYTLLAQILAVRVTDLSQIIAGFGHPFTNPTSCLSVLQKWNKLSNASFPWTELRYIVDAIPTPEDPLALTLLDSMRVSKTLQDKLLDIQATYPTPVDPANVTSDYVRAVTTLILEPAQANNISALLTGTGVYTTVAPIVNGLKFTSRVKSCSNKDVRYTRPPASPDSLLQPSCSLQVTGILDEKEIADLKAAILDLPDLKQSEMPSKKDQAAWVAAVDRVCKKPQDMFANFVNAVSDLFPKDVVTDELEGRKRMILAPDVLETPNTQQQSVERPQVNGAVAASLNVPPVASREVTVNGTGGQPNGVSPPIVQRLPGSNSEKADGSNQVATKVAPVAIPHTSQDKITFFLRYFLPYLQQKLAYASVLDTVSSATGFKDSEVAKTFLTEVVSVPSSALPVLDFNDTQEYKAQQSSQQNALDFLVGSVQANIDVWQGTLSVQEPGDYIFVLGMDTEPEPLQLVTLDNDTVMHGALFSTTSSASKYLELGGAFDKRTYPFKRSSLSTPNTYATRAIALEQDKKYALTLPKLVKDKLQWQNISSAGDAPVAVPAERFSAWWKGYLCPPSTDDYNFSVVAGSKPTCVLTLDGDSKEFTAQDEVDATQIWSTSSSSLGRRIDASRVHHLELDGVLPNEISWKTPTTARSPVPATCLLPDIAPAQVYAILTKLQKLALLLNHLQLNSQEILYIHNHVASWNTMPRSEIPDSNIDPDMDPDQLPIAIFDFDGIHSVNDCLRLRDYVGLRDSIPRSTVQSLQDLFSWAAQTRKASDDNLATQICLATSWSKEQVSAVLAKANFWSGSVSEFSNERILVRMQRLLVMSKKLGVSIPTLFAWAAPTGTNSKDFESYDKVSQNIQKVARSRFDFDAWSQAVRPLNNTLRQNQNSALISYLLAQPDFTRDYNIVDADSLFEFFLIDVQMGPLVETSRMVQATSTVQLFVQRCMMGFEKDVPVDLLDRPQWEWMNQYRLWEANRKVFLYPENWIQPSLRDDKSEIFQQFESELLQKDLNDANVSSAIRNYIYGVADVANLEAIGLFADDTDNNKLHVFARTRTTPLSYYYNFHSNDSGPGTWNGWQKMQIEIPQVADPDTEPMQFGNYVAPVVLNGRLMLFVAEFLQRTVSSGAGETTHFDDMKGINASSLQPQKFWEVKMSWTEFRDNRWTARQTCPSIFQDSETRAAGSYFLIPCLNYVDQNTASPRSVSIYLGSKPNTPGTGAFLSPVAGWMFNGTQLSMMDPTAARNKKTNITDVSSGTSFGVLVSFKVRAELRSWQAKSAPDTGNDITLLGDQLYVEDVDRFNPSDAGLIDPKGPSIKVMTSTGGFSNQSFFHGFIHSLMQILASQKEVLPVFDELGMIGSTPSGDVNPTDDFVDAFGAPQSGERETLYSLYSWELGLYGPMTIIDQLFKAQQYEKALAACRFVFDPLAAGGTGDTRRFWRFAPFKMVTRSTIEDLFSRLQAGKPDSLIADWKSHPFQPHVVARGRPQAYMKWIVMTYIEILIAWGDSLFQMNTLESIPQAIQLYVQASHIYGPRGQTVPRRSSTQPQTYNSLSKKFDAFSNAMVQLEEAFPFSNQTPLPVGKLPNDPDILFPNIFGFAGSLFFGIPDNPNLRALADKIDDRLFKIRNSQDINGKFRTLPLFAPPIDPALLVQAVAQGLSLSSVLVDLQSPLPNCKLHSLLQKAYDLVAETKSLGQSLVIVREKRDGELLSRMRQRHELSVQNAVIDAKKMALDEANRSLAVLQYNRTAAVSRLLHFMKLVGANVSGVPDADNDFSLIDAKIDAPSTASGLSLSPLENEQMDKQNSAQTLSDVLKAISGAIGMLHLLPNVSFNSSPLGVGPTFSYGPDNVAAFTEAGKAGLGITVDTIQFQASMAATKNQYQRAFQDRVLQANSAGLEVSGIDKQILAAKIRVAMASKEIDVQQQQIDNANEVSDFLTSKYSSVELYSWMDGVTKTLFYQTYSEAFAMAKRVEKALQYERPQLASKSYIQAGYWDASRDGLLAGESLGLALKQLETAYVEDRGYDYEISKSVSLRMLDPLKLIALREAGSCEFTLDELLFDMDFPGHYLRRIKSISLTIPCVVGPYSSVNATLDLLSSEYRTKATAQGKPYFKDPEDDDRFAMANCPISSIAVSSAQNESGVFQLDFSDQSTRYMPFEGAGAISKWRLTLPTTRQFDYDTIFDVIMQVRYTSLNGGSALQQAATKAVNDYFSKAGEYAETSGLMAVFDVKNEFASGWARATAGSETSSPPASPVSIDLGDLSTRLPFFVRSRSAKVTKLHLFIDQELASGPSVTTNQDGVELADQDASNKPVIHYSKSDVGQQFGKKWKVELGKNVLVAKKCILIVEYQLA